MIRENYVRNENKIEREPGEVAVITHRGLDPEKPNYYMESSREAFADQISRGFGLEFDLQFTKDGKIVVLHDKDLSRITNGADTRKIGEVNFDELLDMDFNGYHITSFGALLQMIQSNPNGKSLNAIHFKHGVQTKEQMDQILKEFEGANPEHFIFFDLKTKSAKYLKEKDGRLHLAASVAHPHDIERYNSAVGGTLLPLSEVIDNRDVFDWVWLDEWDLSDKDGGQKSLYSEETFKIARDAGLKIALVTPELHGTSPGLLGGEAHPDAGNREKLNKRLKEIFELRPDAMCTDYPDYVKNLKK
jgi:glycerophosphoryl diester phosphodiesterase